MNKTYIFVILLLSQIGCVSAHKFDSLLGPTFENVQSILLNSDKTNLISQLGRPDEVKKIQCDRGPCEFWLYKDSSHKWIRAKFDVDSLTGKIFGKCFYPLDEPEKSKINSVLARFPGAKFRIERRMQIDHKQDAIDYFNDNSNMAMLISDHFQSVTYVAWMNPDLYYYYVHGGPF